MEQYSYLLLSGTLQCTVSLNDPPHLTWKCSSSPSSLSGSRIGSLWCLDLRNEFISATRRRSDEMLTPWEGKCLFLWGLMCTCFWKQVAKFKDFQNIRGSVGMWPGKEKKWKKNALTAAANKNHGLRLAFHCFSSIDIVIAQPPKKYCGSPFQWTKHLWGGPKESGAKWSWVAAEDAGSLAVQNPAREAHSWAIERHLFGREAARACVQARQVLTR